MTAGEMRPPAEDPLLGRVISERYRVLGKLGEGGMGAVYLAEHVFIHKKVALKVLAHDLARREELAARFLQEARAASRIGQENVIDISDFAQTPDGLVYFAMEYLEGRDLGVLLRQEGALPWPRTRAIIVQICKALRAAHALGIVHRDLKPENIFLIEREGRPDFVKLLDFGIAKVTAEPGEEGPRLTRTGMIFGTPEYMAPEQAEGKPADHRVDIYAVGCVLFHCLTGGAPFQAESFMAMLTRHLLEPAVAPSTRRPDLGIPPAVDALVLKALEKDREKRWDSVDQLMAALNASPTPALGVSGEAGVAGVSGVSVTQTWGSQGGQAVIRPRATGPKTDLFPSVDEAGGAEAATAGPRPGRTVRIALVVSGVMLGIVGALLWAFRGSPSPPPAAPAATAPGPAAPAASAPAANAPASTGAVPPTATPPPTAAVPAAAAPTPEATATPPEEPGRDRPRRPARKPSEEAPPPAATTPPARPDPSPIELKPFPQ
jgi:tRNA A-37 threonylcarbamoyl transferase component Bud32